MKVVDIDRIETTKAYYNPAIRKHIILSSGDLGNIYSFAKAVIPPGEISPAHSHENMGEIFLVISGEGIIRINNTDFDMKQGVCAVVEPGESHEIENTGRDDLEIVYYEFEIPSDND